MFAHDEPLREKVEEKKVVPDEFNDLFAMADANLSTKQPPVRSQANSLFDEEPLPQIKPDAFSVRADAQYRPRNLQPFVPQPKVPEAKKQVPVQNSKERI